MNIRNTLKTAAVALPLMLGHGTAVAQKTTQVAQTQGRAVAADTLKAMDHASVDARTFILNKIDSIANAKTDSIMAKKADSIAAKKTRVSAGISVGGARHLPGVGTKAEVEVQKGNNIINASALYSTSHLNSTMYADGSYRRLFPLNKNPNFQFTAGAGATNTVVRDVPNNCDHYGVLSPRLTGGIRYTTPLVKGENAKATSPYFRIQADMGPAANIKYEAQTHSDEHKFQPKFYLNTDAEFGKDHISGFISGGNHPFLGFNMGVGTRVKF